MKKSTILIIVAVFLISVFVVGIFGLQSIPYEQRVYIEQIIPTTITFDSNEGTIEKKIYYSEDDGGYYYVTIPYIPNREGEMIVTVNYDLSPTDATNKRLSVNVKNLDENSNGTLQENGSIALTDRGNIEVIYKAQDQTGGATMRLIIRIKES